MKHLLAIACVVAACLGCRPETATPQAQATPQEPETLVKSGYDQTEMDAAIARARREVDVFIGELAQPTGEDHAVKAPIKDGEETEHFWLTEVSFRDGQFHGTIGNDPGVVTNVKLGQSWSIAKDDISDWMFMREGKMHGNYTMRPLLKTLSDEEAASLKAMLAEP
jgi:uncharacterized protein YegJ (DUF2314 family)